MEILAKQIRNIYTGNSLPRFRVSLMESPTGTRFKMAGCFDSLRNGKIYSCMGEFKDHPKYGETYFCDLAQEYFDYKNNAEGITRFLSSGLIKGIGPSLASKITDEFGEETFTVIEKNPEALLKIKGISKKKLDRIVESYQSKIQFKEIYSELLAYGMTIKQISKILSKYKGNALNIIKNNPYRLYLDIDGIGFKTADRIALNSGIAPESKLRIHALIIYAFEIYQNEKGHVYLYLDDILSVVKNEVPENKAVQSLAAELVSTMVDEKELHVLNNEGIDCFYTPATWACENNIADKIIRLNKNGQNLCFDANMYIPKIEETLREMNQYFTEFDTLQRQAILNAAGSSVSIITGGPGTGKTSTIIGLIIALKSNYPDISIVQCAPTGKAAKRMHQQTGLPSSTIHSLIASVAQDDILDGDVFIIDETSMVDTYLMSAFFSKLPLGCKLIIIGDEDQLPSIGPGMCLGQLIDSGSISCVYLDKIYRQKGECGIVMTSQKIKAGSSQTVLDSSMIIKEAGTDKKCFDSILADYDHYIKEGYSPADIIILCPFRQGNGRLLTSDSINKEISQRYNAGRPEINTGLRVFREGDRVLHTKNNYSFEYYPGDCSIDDIVMEYEEPCGKGVFNGDTGTIEKIFSEEDRAEGIDIALLVRSDEGFLVPYTDDDLYDLTQCFSMSIHKSQGSEYPVVITMAVPSHYYMLKRNLLYTAITRASKICILYTDDRTYAATVKKSDASARQTNLARLVCDKDKKQ